MSLQQYVTDLQLELERQYGKFTQHMVGASSRGVAAISKFIGQHTLCRPTVSGTRRALRHYAHCKAQSPQNTSAVFIMPILSSLKWWCKHTKTMKLVKTLSQEESDLLSPGISKSGIMLGVFWDSPVKSEQGSSESEQPTRSDAAQHNVESERDESPGQIAHAGIICGSSGDHVQLRLQHQLMLLPIRLLGRDVVALVDSGATHNAVDEAFVSKHNLKLGLGPIRKIKLANGVYTKSKGELQSARFTAGGAAMRSNFVAMPMAGEEFQVILGKQWLTAVNPEIDWRANKITINGIPVDAVGSESPPPQQVNMKVCSLRGVLKAARKRGSRTWAILLREKPPSDSGSNASAEATSAAVSAKPTYTPYSPSLTQPDWDQAEKDLKDHPEIFAVLRKHAEVFDPLPDGVPPPDRVKHQIDLEEGARPPYKPPYRMSPLELDELKKQLQGLLDKGWIRPSHSPFGSPVLFAGKPDGSLRLCIDYRALNALTRKSRYPIPRVDEMFDRLYKAKYITTLDFQQGYHQVGMREQDIEKTAFVTRYGQFEWLVMPFGLCNAPSTFQSMMNQFLGTDFDDFVMAYLDDLTVFDGPYEDHVKHLDQVLQRIKEKGYKLRLSKCKFCRPTVDLLGFVVGNGKLYPSPKKIQIVKEWPRPTDVHELRQYLGFCNFYRRFVKSYSQIAAPLTTLLKKGVSYVWEAEHESAFQQLKDTLTSAPALLLPNMELPFYVVCDASDFAVGATLMQDHGQGWQPVAYDGRKMISAELSYVTTDKENLALVHALRTWRCYLEGRKVTVETDHDALKHLLTQPHLNRRQARWVEMLADYDLQIIHKPGKLNRSDPLSRMSFPDPEAETVGLAYSCIVVASALGDDFLEKCRLGYATDTYYEQLNKRHLRNSQLRQQDGLWYMGDKLCIPSSDDGIKTIILKELHDNSTGGHFGFDKTLESVSRRFYWPSLRKDVRLYCKTCPTCQRAKHSNKRPGGLLQPIPTPQHPWEQVTMDLIAKLPLTKRGHNAALVFVDRLTKMVHWIPCTINITAKGLARLYLWNIVRYHGFPKVLISDRDPRLTAGFWRELQEILGTQVKMSTTDHQTDGHTENANKTLLQLLRCYATANPEKWDEYLAMAELSYNSHIQASTGKSPFYANYGRHPVMPIDLSLPAERQSVEDLVRNIREALQQVTDKLVGSQERQRQQANRRRRAVYYHQGDKVLVSSSIFNLKKKEHKKLMPPYMGPFEVVEVTGPVNVRLQLPPHLRTHNVVHVSKLKPFHETPRFGDRGAPPPFDLIDGARHFEVEAIMARKKVGTTYKYLVKFVGFDHCENEWIPRDELHMAMDLVNEFDAQAAA